MIFIQSDFVKPLAFKRMNYANQLAAALKVYKFLRPRCILGYFSGMER